MGKSQKNRTAMAATSVLSMLGLSLSLMSNPTVAAPQHYTIQFSGSSVAASLPTGSFDYDASTPAFSNFVVTWGGLSFDLTSTANSPIIAPGPETVCGVTDAAVSFLLLSKDSCLTAENLAPKKWVVELFSTDSVAFEFVGGGGMRNMFFSTSLAGFGDPEACGFFQCDEGDWSITLSNPTPVSEPASLVLVSLGLAGWAASRRRRK